MLDGCRPDARQTDGCELKSVIFKSQRETKTKHLKECQLLCIKQSEARVAILYF